ncbi:MAG: molybdate transport system ATP-binding protein [Clostridiales bacterium]|jgi:molybdate transport system ATP-binding protein|nr:molybdate transport system ATP-binding protein [Clostridiales bacterium]MDN5281672.1 molybdate transport system ATP-binding protein [Candidatus Ozemobacter sp.]
MQLRLEFTLKRECFRLETDQVINSTLTGVFGPSGCGKTTLLESICGLIRPTKGLIEFNGKTFFSSEDNIFISPQKRKVGIVFQDIRIFSHLNVKKNLEYGYKLVPEKDRVISFEEVVKLLELESFLSRNSESLSGGEKQRLAIGRALLCSPDLLLLDEPFSALDHGMRQTILPYLARIEKSLNLPMIIVSHHLPDLKQLTEKILFIENGKTTRYIEAEEA